MQYILKQLFYLFVLLLSLAAISIAVANESHPRTILVLDASGSMWGQIQGKTKIEIARQVISDLLKNPQFSLELGLTVYGHRHKGDCSDIEHIIPAAQGNSKYIMQVVNKLNPKGKTPLSDAVQQAAEQLRYTEEKATVILVTDGKETCDRDPCALGKVLEEKGLEFTTHVIGFAVAKEERAKLKCLADATGGLFLTAADASTLTSALDTAVNQVRAAPEPSTRLIAMLGDSTEPAPMTVEWTIFKAAEDDVKGIQMVTATGASTIVRLPDGRYIVEARAANVAGRSIIQIEADKDSRHWVHLNAGKVVLSALAADNSTLFTARQPVFWGIYPLKKGKPASRYIATLGGNPVTFMLAPGNYLARANSGTNKGELAFSIAPGETTETSFVLATGEVELKAVNSKNGSLFSAGKTVFWRIYPLDAEGKQPKRYLTSNKGNPRRFTLPPGHYLATAESTGINARTIFEVLADQIIAAEAVLAKAETQLKLVSSSGGTAFMANKAVVWRIYHIGTDGKTGKRVALKRGNPASVELGVGQYEAQYQTGKIRGSKHFSLHAGKNNIIEVVIVAR